MATVYLAQDLKHRRPVAVKVLHPEIAATIDRDRKLAEALGINGTPSFIIGDTLVPGASDISYLKDLIQKARSGAKPKAAE